MLFKTDRLIIREIKESDVEHLHQMNNNENVMKYINTKAFENKPIEKAIESVNKWTSYYKENPGFGLFMVDLKDEPIGWVCLRYLEGLEGYELGYRFKEKHWKKGYASEASKVLIDYAFNEKNIKSISAVAIEANIGSTSVMKKVGMSFNRTDFLYDENVVIYSIVNGSITND